jgi:hypothetical protein
MRIYVAQDKPYMPDNFHNLLENYTNWQVMLACFSPAEIQEAIDYRTQLQVETLDSADLTEKVQMADFIGNSSNVVSLEQQLAQAFGTHMVYPYLDDLLLWANLRFDPRQRFYKNGWTKPVLKYILETKSASQATRARKAGGGFSRDLFAWMRGGVMGELVEDMQRPDFLNQADFELIKRAPNWFTWSALNYDLFIKHVVKMV